MVQQRQLKEAINETKLESRENLDKLTRAVMERLDDIGEIIDSNKSGN